MFMNIENVPEQRHFKMFLKNLFGNISECSIRLKMFLKNLFGNISECSIRTFQNVPRHSKSSQNKYVNISIVSNE